MKNIPTPKLPKTTRLKESKFSVHRRLLDDALVVFLKGDVAHFQDPLECVDRSLSSADTELIAFLVSGLSYGRVEQIKKSSYLLLHQLEKAKISFSGGQGLADFLKSETELEQRKIFEKALLGWKHRLNTSKDLVEVLLALGKILKTEKSLARLYQRSQNEFQNPKDQVQYFSLSLFPELRTRKVRASFSKWQGTGKHWFAPQPNDGGTCKRLLMYFRWMIRKDHFDLGCWQDKNLLNSRWPPPKIENLFVPVDTHVLKWANREKIVKLKSPNWNTVEAITEYFRKVNESDPLKYDFMICHEGMKVFREPKTKG